MEQYVFAKKINGTDQTGIVDISKNPPELMCLCSEVQSNRLLQALNTSKQEITVSAAEAKHLFTTEDIERESAKYADLFPHPTNEREHRYIKKSFKDALAMTSNISDAEIREYRKQGYVNAFTRRPKFRELADKQFDENYDKTDWNILPTFKQKR